MNWLTPELFFGTFLGTLITILLAQVVFIQIILKNQRDITDAKIQGLRDLLEKTISLSNAGGLKSTMSITIVQPKNFINKEPKRKIKQDWEMPVRVKGISSGKIGSAYLAYFINYESGYRPVCRLNIDENGAWEGVFKISKYDNGLKYDMVAIAISNNLDLKLNERISIAPDMTLSNTVPIQLILDKEESRVARIG